MKKTDSNETLQVSEVYSSIQGESNYAGWPCVFVRLTGCPLRCRWCDTAYAFKGGEKMPLEVIMQKVRDFNMGMVELTGGEPLAQDAAPRLIEKLIAEKYKVLIETSGAEDISVLPVETHIVMDLKCPDSGMMQHNRYENIKCLKTSDEIKFVCASRNDFIWACDTIKKYKLDELCYLSFSPAWGHVQPKDLVAWLLESGITARLNLQQHKYIWGPRAKSV